MRVIRININYSVLKHGAIGISYKFQEFMDILSTYNVHSPLFAALRKRYEEIAKNDYVIAFKKESLKDEYIGDLSHRTWKDWVFLTTSMPYETVDIPFEDPFNTFRTLDGELL